MAEKKMVSQILGTVKGTLAGIIINLTGEVIEVSKKKTISEPEFVRGEFAIIHKIANSLAEDLKLGPLRELILSFDIYTIISVMIGHDYCLILFLDETASLGLVRKKMSSLIPSLEKELYPE